MSALLKFEQTAYWQECYNCGIAFGLTSSWDERLRKSHNTFYCPNGHPQSYNGANEAEKLRAELAAEKVKREIAERAAEWDRHVAKSALTQKTKAENKLKRITLRVNAGVCPHCNRTFKQLAAHIKSKHAALTSGEAHGCRHDHDADGGGA